MLGYVQASKTTVKLQENKNVKNNFFNFNRDLTGLWPARALIKAASSDEQALAGRACRTAAPSDCMLTCYLHVMMGRKHAVNIMSIRWCLSDFLCPVGGAMDMTQFWCTDIFRATPSTFLRDLEGDNFQSRHEFDKNGVSHQNGRLPVGVTV